MSDNIKVVVKVRPLISREIEDKLSLQWRIKNNTLFQIDQKGRDLGPSFTFDKVYEQEGNTYDIYNDIAKPIVEAAISGVNGTIFAYGQTSSGKTYTMSGTEDSPGIIPLAVLNLYKTIRNIPNRDFLVRVAYIEIYNETLRDLLNLERKVKVQENLNGSGVKVDCTEHVTTSPEEVLKYLKQGEVNRQTGSTNMNEQSSRSHSIFQITIESREHIEGEEQTGCVNVSTLNLVDLAGSERAGQTGTTGLRFKEGTHINMSLSNLALVIKQLSEDQNKYVNYRDSKLTRILQNSLGGNAKTSIICAITPAAVEETISTLQFANRAKAIKNKPEVNAVATDKTMIQSLTKQLSKLQSQLESKKNLEVMLESKKNVEQDNYNLQKQIAALQKLILNGFGQRTSLEGRRKIVPPRRITISTLHPIEENPVPILPKLHTPLLKYNPMTTGPSDFVPIQNMSTLSRVSEENENRLITPPPSNQKSVKFDNDEIIDLDSDDDNSSLEIQTCSPYHTCRGSTTTPPCVLRKSAKIAEKNLKDIVELTEREKIYTPSVIELIEKLEQNAAVITKLQEEMTTLHKKGKDKDLEIDQLRVKVNKSNEEIKSMSSEKSTLELLCSEYTKKLTDWEVTFETLKKKTKQREEELLSLLEEQRYKTIHKRIEDYDKLPQRSIEKEVNFMDMSKDLSLVSSDIENSIHSDKDQEVLQLQNKLTVIQSDFSSKNLLTEELKASIEAQSSKIELRSKITIDELQEKILFTESENSLLKSTVETLQSTIQSQKSNLEAAHNDIESYNGLIQELQVKLSNKDNIKNTVIKESLIDNMIANEQLFIANNENIKNIINSLRLTLDKKNKEIESLRAKSQILEDSSTIISNDLKTEILNKEQQSSLLLTEINTLKNQLNDNTLLIDNLTQTLDKKNKEIESLRAKSQILEDSSTIISNDLKTEILNKEQQSSLLLTEINTLKNQLNDNTLLIDNLTQEKQKETENGICLTRQLAEAKTKYKELEKSYEENKTKLLAMEADNFKLLTTITEKDAHEIHIQENFKKLNETINNLEKDINTKDNIIKDLEMKLTENQENIAQIRESVNSLNKSFYKLIGCEFNVSDNANNDVEIINNTLNIILLKIMEKMTQTDDDIKSLHICNENLLIDLNKIKIENEQLLQYEHDYNENKITNEQLTKELQKTTVELDSYILKIGSLENELKTCKDDTKKLYVDLQQKDDTISTLKEKETFLTSQLKSLQEQDIIINELALQREKLQNDLNIKESIISQKEKVLVSQKETLLQLENSLLENVNTIENLHTKNRKIIDRNYTELYKIYDSIITFIDALNMDKICELNLYENIENRLHKIMVCVSDMKNENMEESLNFSQYLLESKIELACLKGQNEKLLENISLFKETGDHLATYLDEIKLEHKDLNQDLVASNDTLKQLRKELIQKANDFEEIIMKSQHLKESVTELHQIIQTQMKELENVKTNIKSKITEHHNNKETANDIKNIGKKVLINYYPLSLHTICCNKVQEMIKPEISISSSTSDLSTEHTEFYGKKECDHKEIISELKSSQSDNLRLSKRVTDLELFNDKLIYECENLHKEKESYHKEIISAKSENVRLSKIVKRLESVNEELISEHEEVKREVELLIAPTNELQKKIKNHKTNLSTLTATTYAENGLLKTQVKVLQHHHNRYHNVCQKDFPVIKKQLYELLTILKNDNSFIDKRSSSIKRFSLPCVLDNDSTLHNLKNDSTLDGDILMLDTNVTVTSTIDNTLTGIDQTCSDITQIISSTDVACQTVNDSACIQPINNESHVENRCEDKQLSEKYYLLEKENDMLLLKLKECTQNNITKCDAQTSPLKLNTVNQLENSFTTDELNSCLQKLAALTAEKDDLKKKYNGVLMEISTLELNCNHKDQELSRINTLLSGKIDEIKQLQEENDSLSTQVFEIITENDKLQIKVETLQTFNDKLEKQILEMESEKLPESLKCSQCLTTYNRIEMTKNLELHAKLNRSLSDSESSTRLNKISTLQNELHAGREDCIELHKEVSTIKSQLECSNLSIVENMDLDDSIKDFNSLPIENNNQLDTYTLDKTECLKYFIHKTGFEIEKFSSNTQCIDIMKMLYTDIMSKHSSEVGNLVNELKCHEVAKNQIECRLQDLMAKHSKITLLLQEKDNILATNIDTVFQIKKNFNSFTEQISNISEVDDKNATYIAIFKERFLELLDTSFGLCSSNLFENLIKSISKTYEKKLTNIKEQYTSLQATMVNTTAELKALNENILELKCQLSNRENEYNLLKAQKEKIHEICNAVTLDLIKKEQNLYRIITEGCTILKEKNIFSSDNIDTNLPIADNLRLLTEQVVSEFTIKITEIEVEKECLMLELEKSISEKEENRVKVETLQNETQHLQKLNQILIDDKTNLSDELVSQKASYTDLRKLYDSILEENSVKNTQINDLTVQLKNLRKDILQKESIIYDLNSLKENSLHVKENEELLNSITKYTTEINELKNANDIITKEKEVCLKELQISKDTIEANKQALNKMTSDILVLNETVKENVCIIESSKKKVSDLMQDNSELKLKLEEKCTECARLEMNFKTLEKTVEVQSRIITRLKMQIEEQEKAVIEKNTKIEELTLKCTELSKECEDMNNNIVMSKEEIHRLKTEKETLECKLSKLELELADTHKTQINAIADTSRRRRQSIHDSKRLFGEDSGDHNKLEAVFDSRPKQADLFMDVDEISSNRSTPRRHSRGRDSLTRQDQSDREDEHPSRPSSVAAMRRRRQSLHDMRRVGVCPTPSPQEHSSPRLSDSSNNKSLETSSHNNSDISQLRERLTSCQQELEELRDRYRELDEECEICAKYLREREDQCLRLSKEKDALDNIVTELKEKLQGGNQNQTQLEAKCTLANSAVNTDEEYSSSRQSDASNSKSSEPNTSHPQSDVSQLMERLTSCQQELKELKERYRELDEECEICAKYLRESEDQCLRLTKEKDALDNVIADLKTKLLEVNSSTNPEKSKPTFADAAANTDQDWSNLHSVVVDRMSYDIEVEMNKRLTKKVEELRFRKQELKNTISKMQKHIERNASKDCNKELEATRAELKSCQQELQELTKKYKELDEECETCSEYLREREEQCIKLREVKAALESKLQQYEEAKGAAQARQRRRDAHDRARLSQEFNCDHVDNESCTKEIAHLKSMVDKLNQQKISLENQLNSVPSTPNPMFIATGSAIVQNQQITDVLRENQKLRKMNAKLVKVCTKRGKQADVENMDIAEST